MQKSTNQTSHLNPYQNSFDVTVFLLDRAKEEYERLTITMYAQQMANVKTYIWTGNLIVTGAIFLLVQFKTDLISSGNILIAYGLAVTIFSSLISIGFSISCLLAKFKRPVVNFPAWESWFKTECKKANVRDAEAKFREGLLNRINDAIETSHAQITSNGNRLFFSNIFLTIGIGAAFISLLIFIFSLIKGGL